MRILVFGLLFVGVAGLSWLLGWLPAGLLTPFRLFELKALYRISTRGPGGFDDAVQTRVMNHPKRYSAPLIRMLRRSRPGTFEEEVGLFFVELVRVDPEVDTCLTGFAERHPDPQVREFVQRVLDSAPPDRRAS